MTSGATAVSQTVLLARTFFVRFFESDLLPPGVPQAQFTIWALSGLAAPGLLLPTVFASQYLELANHPHALTQALVVHRLLFITLTMIALGLVALVVWEGVFPDRRDARIIAVLPIRGSVLLVARLAALAAVASIFLIGTNAVPTLMYGPVLAAYGAATNGLRGAVAHLFATACAGAFVFFSLIALQGILLNIGSRRVAERLSIVMQLVFVIALLQLIFFFPHVRGLVHGDVGVVASDPVLRLLPSVWFLALYDVAGGMPADRSWPAAMLALLVTVGTAAAAVTLMATTHRRMLRMALESQPAARGTTGIRWARVPAALSIGKPPRRALRRFTLQTMARSRTHRMLLALYAGIALALVISGFLPLLLRPDATAFAVPSVPLLSPPLVMTFLMLAGMKAGFALPVEPRANWVVRLSESKDRGAAIDGVRDAMLLAAVAPASLVGFASAAGLWGLWPGVVHGVVCLLLGWCLVDLLLLNVKKLPYTCTYYPGLSRLRVLWWAYLTAFTTYAYSTPLFERLMIRNPSRFVVFAATAAGVLVLLEGLRAQRLEALGAFKYHEEDPAAMFAGFDLSEGLAANARIEPHA